LSHKLFRKWLFNCVRECRFSKIIWHKIGFSSPSFFSTISAHDWIKEGENCARSIIFLAGLWWTWRHRNLMCLNNETWSITRLCININNSADLISSCLQNSTSSTPSDRLVRWNNNGNIYAILNVDGSCIGNPTRAGFGGIIHNNFGNYLPGFSGFIYNSKDILLAELSAIHQGLKLAINMGIEELVCYSDSLLSINLISGVTSQFHIYAVLIQDIKDLLATRSFSKFLYSTYP